jgi:hypothetical protein
MSKSTLKMLTALMIAIAALVAQPIFGGDIPIPTLTLTEVSNTQLNWAWDTAGGGTFGTQTTLRPDVWFDFSISGPGVGAAFASVAQWQEPENAGFNNLLNYLASALGGPDSWRFSVVSDVITPGATIPDGQPYSGPGFNIVFVDSAATSETATVPDTGTTFSLFGLSLMGLGFLRRKVLA